MGVGCGKHATFTKIENSATGITLELEWGGQKARNLLALNVRCHQTYIGKLGNHGNSEEGAARDRNEGVLSIFETTGKGDPLGIHVWMERRRGPGNEAHIPTSRGKESASEKDGSTMDCSGVTS